MTDEYISQSDFCKRYLIAKRTAERWRVTGDGPRWVRLGQRRVGYRLSDCERWALERTYRHRAEELQQN